MDQLEKEARRERENRTHRELLRLRRIVKQAPKKKQEALAGILENLAFMRVKLDETRDQIAEQPLSTLYDNGGGQTGIRENPEFKAYEAMWKSYLSGLNLILQALPEDKAKDAAPKEDEGATVLELLRAKRQRQA